MKLRKGIKSDLENIFEIETQVYEKSYWNKKMLNDVLSGKTNSTIWIYELYFIVMGFVIDLCCGDEINILNIAIGKPFQNRGHGSKMVNNYLKYLPQNCTVFLEVKKNNYRALKIYSKLNFQKLSKRKAYYNDGLDAFNMMLVR